MQNKLSGKPSKRFFAKALPANGGGFHAQYAAPGLVPGYVMLGGEKEVFNTEFEAHFAAQKTLIEILQSRLDRPEYRARYKMTTANELSEALDNADITAQRFSWLSGSVPKRVMGWLDGTFDIPHNVYMLALLLADEDVEERVANWTDERTEDRNAD